MNRVILTLVWIYVIGVGVQLAPTVRESWDTVTASQLTSRVTAQLPAAAVWPMRVYEEVRGPAQPV